MSHVLQYRVRLTGAVLAQDVVEPAVHAAYVTDVVFTTIGAPAPFLVLKLFLCKHNQLFLSLS